MPPKDDSQFPKAINLRSPRRKDMPNRRYSGYVEFYTQHRSRIIVPFVRHRVNEPLILPTPDPLVAKYIKEACKGSLFTVHYAVYDASCYTWVYCTDGFGGNVIRPLSYLDDLVILQVEDIDFTAMKYFGDMYVNGEDLWTTKCGQRVNVFEYVHHTHGRILLVPASKEFFSCAYIPPPSLLN
jgi:hypothetical protein